VVPSTPHTGPKAWRLVVPPLAVFFEVFEEPRVVLVYRFTYRPS
jgi:hypothetical protein